TATDQNGSVDFYKFALTSGSGNFTIDGGALGPSIKVPASQLANIGFSTGAMAGIDKISVVAIDHRGGISAPLDLSINVSQPTGTAPAPSPAVLADLSLDVYNTIPKGADGYSVASYDKFGEKQYFNSDGFFATTYSNTDGSQIVISIEGTD